MTDKQYDDLAVRVQGMQRKLEGFDEVIERLSRYESGIRALTTTNGHDAIKVLTRKLYQYRAVIESDR